ncbi:glycosyltransferase family 2 protein [Candidatus Falkowbacteria bacterium]|nr:glycosyltransferase family 2 protein [Candidatus Falkowbacteria bacterium]
MNNFAGDKELSVILPCRNESQAIAFCIKEILAVFAEKKINGEVIVSDSSQDGSADIAQSLGAGVIRHNKLGYGNAILEGLKACRGEYIFIADADGTYDFKEISNFLETLKQGNDMVIGNRLAGKMEKGAMPRLHRFFGNPALSFLLRLFFKAKIRDAHSGMRAIRKEAINQLGLRTTGMEFASEMIIKAVKNKLKIKELPINYYNRKGDSKLRTWADGWRHLRFMLLYSPLFLFFIPGATLFLVGLVLTALLYFDIVAVFGLRLFYHPMFLTISLIIVGYQLIIFSVFAKTYAITHLGEESKPMNYIHHYVTIEKAILAGLIFGGIGVFIYLYIFIKWLSSGFQALEEIENSLIALALIIFGIQTVFSSFMLSILGIKER